MAINSTGIRDLSDFSSRNKDDMKLLLAEEIITTFMPLFREENEKKKSHLENVKSDYLKLKEKSFKTSNNLEHLSLEVKKQKLISKCLFEIKRMADNDVLYGNNKHIVTKIISKLEKGNLTTEDVTKQLGLLNKLVHKSINRIID